VSRLVPKDDNWMINGPGKYTVKTAAFRVTIIADLKLRARRRRRPSRENPVMKAKP